MPEPSHYLNNRPGFKPFQMGSVMHIPGKAESTSQSPLLKIVEQLIGKSRPKAPQIPEPTVSEMATNFLEATAKWSSAGFPIVSKENYEARAAVCNGCEFWDG